MAWIDVQQFIDWYRECKTPDDFRALMEEIRYARGLESEPPKLRAIEECIHYQRIGDTERLAAKERYLGLPPREPAPEPSKAECDLALWRSVREGLLRNLADTCDRQGGVLDRADHARHSAQLEVVERRIERLERIIAKAPKIEALTHSPLEGEAAAAQAALDRLMSEERNG